VNLALLPDVTGAAEGFFAVTGLVPGAERLAAALSGFFATAFFAAALAVFAMV
jgi:hypothetical protein